MHILSLLTHFFHPTHNASPMIIIGLQNPGKKYHNTRHNAGGLFIDALMTSFNTSPLSEKKNLHTELTSHTLGTEKIILAKPLTYMNTSGKSAGALMRFYKAHPSHALIVAHDDLDLPLGAYKISRDKNAAGHNGIQDIINHLGTKDFIRIRIGIDHRSEQQRARQSGADYVLGTFSSQELSQLHNVFAQIISDDVIQKAVLAS